MKIFKYEKPFRLLNTWSLYEYRPYWIYLIIFKKWRLGKFMGGFILEHEAIK